MKDKKEMIRVLRLPEGGYTLDATGRKNGRGAYVCQNPDCLNKAIRNKGLERSFKATISPEIYDQLREELKKLDTK